MCLLKATFATSSIGIGNGLNTYLNFMVRGSISTEDKNSTSEGSREDHEVAVSGPPKIGP
ncbi:hypothetical protein A2U01_0069223 [Trifolium medium]|uniref:Uncharacterized protein n=1 Tax=Trifolium medium TaxID=97028 RepID=A0A392SGH8_9FABA|nr:hypothetical protein [Trifolium medium]